MTAFKNKINIFNYWKINIDSLSEEQRNKNIILNIKLSFLFRIILFILNLFAVPLLLSTLGFESYGVWISIISLASWITLMDIGISLSLRNKVTFALLNMDYNLANQYISTFFFYFSRLFFIVIICSFFFILNVNWQVLLNTKSINEISLKISIVLIVISICVNFLFGAVNQLINSVQLSSLSNLMNIIFNVIFMIGVYFYKYKHTANLIHISLFYLISQLLSILIINYFFFSEYKYLFPKKSNFKKKFIIDLLKSGKNFFIIQIGLLIMFSTDNFLVGYLFGPKEVVSYSTYFRLYGTIGTVAGLFMSPLWSSYSEAYANGKYNWILKSFKNIKLLLLPIIFVLIILFLFSDKLVYLWVGQYIKVNFTLKLYLSLFVILNIWNTMFANFLNSIGQTRVNMICSLLSIFLNTFLAVYFAKYLHLGPSGVVLSTIISLSLFSISGSIEAHKILNRSKLGQKITYE
jgi:O-antigen/teichoic acid export membrane protein